MKKQNAPLLVLLILVAAILGLSLTACSGDAQHDIAVQELPSEPDPSVTELAIVVSDEADLAALDRYPSLRKLDLSGSLCYDAIDAYAAGHPEVQVIYTIPLGPTACRSDTQSMSLLDGQYEPALLLQALPHLQSLQILELPLTALDLDTIEQLAAAMPQGDLRFSRRFLDRELPGETVEIDLSDLDMEQLRPALPVLSTLPQLQTLRLLRADGSSPYTLEDAIQIHSAAPDVFLDYRFTLFGKAVSTADESLSYLDTPIGDEGLPLLRQALSLMPRCKTVTLDDCGTSNEAMAALREELAEQVKIVWRVHFGIFSDLTDTKIIHAVADEHHTKINDEMCEVLRYCTETEYIDLGHDPLTTIEFCRYMPKLKMAILSYNPFSDLSPLADHEDLIFLEIFACRRLDDLSPLASCKNLRMLNISYSTATDITPLYALEQLELFHAARTDIPREQIDELQSRLPGCRITYDGSDIHEVGWRKVQEGQYYDWYLEIREIFGYSDPESYSHKPGT